MSSSSVWVQLYYEGKENPRGEPVEIKPPPGNVNDLKKAVKTELKPKLEHAPVDEISVFSPDTKPPFSEQTFIRGDKTLKDLIDELGNKTPLVSIDYDHPLIVLAPAPSPHPREQQSLLLRQQLEQHDTIEITLIYGRKRETCAVMKNELSLSAILKTARELLKIPIAALAFSYVKDSAEIPLKDNKVVASLIIRPNLNACIIRVKNLQEGFSSFTSVKDALRLVDATSDNDKLPVSDDKFPKPLTEFSEQQNEELFHAMDTIRRLKDVVPIEQSHEATRRLYIDPILLASARVAGGEEKDVKMMVEQVYENEDVNGPIDYVFSFKDVTMCVTEGKKDSLDRGIAQNIAQLVAVRDANTRKRKHHEMEEEQQTIFGIATTYVEWAFIRLEGSTIVQTTHRSISLETRPDEIKKIVGLIVAILQEGKKKVN